MKKILLLIIICLFACSIYSYPYSMESASSVGMGNAKTAVADDENAIFQNPAGLADINNLSLVLFGDLLMYSWAGDSYLNSSGEYFNIASSISLVNKNYGFNIFYRSEGEQNNNLDYIDVDKLGVTIKEVVITGAYGLRITDYFSLGMNVKYDFFVDEMVDGKNTVLFGIAALFKFMENFKIGINVHDLGGFNFNGYCIFDDYGRVLSSGILPWDIDIGISYRLNETLLIAFDMNNIIGEEINMPQVVPADAEYFDPAMANLTRYNIGLRCHLIDSLVIYSGVVFAEDIQDFYSIAGKTHSYKKVFKTIASVGFDWKYENFIIGLAINNDFRQVENIYLPFGYFIEIEYVFGR